MLAAMIWVDLTLSLGATNGLGRFFRVSLHAIDHGTWQS